MKPSHSYYGSREVDAARLSVLLAEATGLKFMPRHSFYIGDYYFAGKPGGDSIDVRPNEIEDEDGKFLQWKEFVGYQTIVEIGEASEGFFEELRPKLAEVEGLASGTRLCVVVQRGAAAHYFLTSISTSP